MLKEEQTKPFFELTLRMLNDVRDRNFADLAQVCDDDFGTIDINTEGGSEVIRNREGWGKVVPFSFKATGGDEVPDMVGDHRVRKPGYDRYGLQCG